MLPVGAAITRVLAAAVNAVNPFHLIPRVVNYHSNTLTVCNHTFFLPPEGNVYVIGAGKASGAMACALCAVLGDRIHAGLIITKDGYLPPDNHLFAYNVSIHAASHPLPDERGVQASQEMIALVENLSSKDTVILLLSGGGSAMLTQPAGGITLGEIRQVTDHLLKAGATISELNSVRKRLDLLKGGGLARIIYPARLIVLIISDVLEDRLDVIASGPGYSNPTGTEDVEEIAAKYHPPVHLGNLRNRVSAQDVTMGLQKYVGEAEVFKNVHHFILGNINTAALAAKQQAISEGFDTYLLSTSLAGEARFRGQQLAKLAHTYSSPSNKFTRPRCIILGGETTVTVTGSGIGGRNQEMALATVKYLSDFPDAIFISLATDGGDGPTDAAGAVSTGTTYRRAIAHQMDPNKYLQENDAYSFFATLGDLINPGPTLTNVNDIQLLVLL